MFSYLEQSPSWEANRSWTSQEIRHIVRNPEVHDHIEQSSPPVLILSQINPVHASTSHFLKSATEILPSS
jgi:hypothetical protein